MVFGLRAPRHGAGNHRVTRFWWLDMHIRQGVFAIEDDSGNYNSTGLIIVPTKDYIITVRRVDTNGNGLTFSKAGRSGWTTT